jgi:hypothetical protein
MELLNATRMRAGYTMGMQPDGRELLVVVVKGTFTIPKDPKKEPTLAEEQVPLVEADVFTGEPGLSAPLYESDYAPRKPRCDVLLNGSAYAPRGRPATRVTVSLQVGSLHKSFDVVGNRSWKSGVFMVGSTDPEPFTVMPISYNNAFGGVDHSQKDPAKHRWYPANHAGVGYHEYLDAEFIEGKPLPNTEETGRRVTDPRGKYKPMAFGPIGRAWQPRPKYAGTYGQKWLDEVFPFLPADFKEDYYQAAPEDQQMLYPEGGEEIVLTNLTPEGKTAFTLPHINVPVMYFYRDDDSELKTEQARLDTVLVEPDQARIILTWRSHVSLKRNIFEISRGVVGELSRGWQKALRKGKTYYPSLGQLIGHGRTAGGEAG